MPDSRAMGAGGMPADPLREALSAEIRRVQTKTRPRWKVRLPFLAGAPEGYGATLREAMEAAAEGIMSEDEEAARAALAAHQQEADPLDVPVAADETEEIEQGVKRSDRYSHRGTPDPLTPEEAKTLLDRDRHEVPDAARVEHYDCLVCSAHSKLRALASTEGDG